MGAHDSLRGKLIAQATQERDKLLNELAANSDDIEEPRLIESLQAAKARLREAEAMEPHTYWCDFCHKDFISIERMVITLRSIYDHDAQGNAIKHWLDGKVLVMCPDCKIKINPIEGATLEPD